MTEFRKNWWQHTCVNDTLIWKHKQYMRCDVCGFYNGKTQVTRSTL